MRSYLLQDATQKELKAIGQKGGQGGYKCIDATQKELKGPPPAVQSLQATQGCNSERIERVVFDPSHLCCLLYLSHERGDATQKELKAQTARITAVKSIMDLDATQKELKVPTEAWSSRESPVVCDATQKELKVVLQQHRHVLPPYRCNSERIESRLGP